jgi:hypothetical protein
MLPIGGQVWAAANAAPGAGNQARREANTEKRDLFW